MNTFAAVAHAIVTDAGARLRQAWRNPKRIDYKGPIDLVTDTDRAIEALLPARLRQEFPDHLIIGEEGGAALTPPPRDRYVWYLDPIDGTTNFAHSHPQFCVSLALARDAELLLGIVHDPIREETFFAQQGCGATLNGEPICVSTVDDLDRALLGTGFPYDRREHADFYLGFLKDFMQRAQGIRRTGSAALDLCYVACGRLDGFWEWKLKPWDVAAGALIVQEAGGRVSDFRGDALDLFGEQTLASNGSLHEAMVAVIGARMAAT